MCRNYAFQRNSNIEPFFVIIGAEHSDIPLDASKLHKQPQTALRYSLMTSLSLFKAYLDNIKHKQTPIDTHRHPQTSKDAKRCQQALQDILRWHFWACGDVFFSCFVVSLSCWDLMLWRDVWRGCLRAYKW